LAYRKIKAKQKEMERIARGDTFSCARNVPQVEQKMLNLDINPVGKLTPGNMRM